MSLQDTVTNISLKQRIALELNRKLNQNMRSLHELKQLFWECTLRCNLSCRHCGSDCKISARQEDMPLKDFLRVLDSITPHVNPNEVLIILSGGEPSMRQDLEVCGREFQRRGFPWGMVTNGMAITEERLNRLVAAGLRSITVSIDGFEEDHNWMRGHKESFNRAIRAVKCIAKHPQLSWDVVTCINQRTVTYLPQLKDYLYNQGIKNWRLFTIFPQGRATENQELRLKHDQHKQLMEFLVEARKDPAMHVYYECEGFLGGYEGKVRDHLYQCIAGVSVAGVLINGDISACTSIRCNYVQGNIYKDDFWQIWDKGYKPYRDRQWMRHGKCADCKVFRYCEGGGMHLRDDEGNMTFCQYRNLLGIEP